MKNRKTFVCLSLMLVLTLVLGCLPAFAADTSPAAFGEAPMLAERVAAGELPAVSDRLPKNPLVLAPKDGIGVYGGELRTRLNNPGDWGDIWHSTYPHLIWFSEDTSQYLPELCEAFELNEDSTLLTLYLREGLKWSDGEPFDADDIECFWKDFRMNPEVNPDMTPPGDYAPGGVAMEVTKVDQYTVTFSFSVPYPGILAVLTSWNGMPGRIFLPAHLVRAIHPDYAEDADAKAQELYGEYTTVNSWVDAVGYIANMMWPGGDPYGLLPTLGMWKQKTNTTTEIVFERNPYYYAVDTAGNQLPYIDTVRAEIVPDDEVANLNVMQGKYDFGKVKPDKLALIKSKEAEGNYAVRLYTGDNASSPLYAFNLNHRDPAVREIFNDVRFRKAMSLAINREELNDLVYDGFGTPTQATINRTASFYDPAWAEANAQYDPDAANALLDEMGLDKRGSDGFRLRPDGKPLLITMEMQANKGDELVMNYWNEVGVRTQLNPVDSSLYWERGQSGELDLGVAGLDNSVEFKAFSVISKYFLGNLDLCPAVDWVKWFDTNGTDGEAPPADVQAYFAAWHAVKSATGDEYDRLAREIFQAISDNIWLIGTVGYGLNAVYVNNNLRNVPESALFMDPTNWWLLTRPDQWYFAQ